MGRGRQIVDVAATTALVACALIVTGLLIRRELDKAEPRSSRSSEVRPIADWQGLLRGGHRMGPADARFVIVEFSDFQCPYCRKAAAVLDSLRQRYTDRIAIVYRHFPLESIHPHALTAALAAECAAEQGAFARFHDTLFQHQGSIGTEPWESLAV